MNSSLDYVLSPEYLKMKNTSKRLDTMSVLIILALNLAFTNNLRIIKGNERCHQYETICSVLWNTKYIQQTKPLNKAV